MLVNRRKKDECIVIGEYPNDTVVTVTEARGWVRIGVHADRGVPVHRAEVYERIHPDQFVTPSGVRLRAKPSVENLNNPEED